jgi:ferredoxin-NADP reductase
LLYSVREPSAILYGTELQVPSEKDSLNITYAYTRITPKNWPRPAGRIDATLLAESTWPADSNATYYVCGPTSFVESASNLLTAFGISPKKIKTERFGPTGERQ